jgi:UDP-N-acetyl-D-galactosamine dehydrogenase
MGTDKPGSADLPERIGVVGLGYVGLALATAFGRVHPTIGFDIDPGRVRELSAGHDRNLEFSAEEIRAPYLEFTSDPAALRRARFIIAAIPTPVDSAKQPDLSLLISASRLIGQNLSPGTVVVYESTVYPGVTEEVCLPELERASGLKAGRDFKVGYSPERINPGDPEHTLEKIAKVVAGQDPETTELMARVYGLVVKAPIHRAPDIRTAEAAKVIENVQRDLNIALMNELAMLFHRLGLDTREVLKAARTKWNFVPVEPGLVSGHCIPVDPYYLTYKAQQVGHHPELILAGRRINEAMPAYIARQTVKLLIRAGRVVQGSRVLVLGVTIKENVRDTRNSRVVELVRELGEYGVEVEVYDPLVGPEGIRGELGLRPAAGDPFGSGPRYDGVVLAVKHRALVERGPEGFLGLLRSDSGPGVIVDVRGALAGAFRNNPNVIYWSL